MKKAIKNTYQAMYQNNNINFNEKLLVTSITMLILLTLIVFTVIASI